MCWPVAVSPSSKPSLETPGNIPVLCTRPLPDDLLQDAAAAGVQIDCIPFIHTEAIASVEVQQEIEQLMLQSITVVFTSMNAVEAVAAELEGQQPDWQVYCIGSATRRLVAEYFGEQAIAGAAPDGARLAEMVVEESGADEVFFFCGDQRRDELPAIIRAAGIELHEITVYHTVELPRKIQQDYPAVLFFSPSAVRSYFRHNGLASGAVAFAIGKTTAAEIRRYSPNEIILSETPDKEQLVRQVLQWFT